MNSVTDQEIIECAYLLSSEFSEACFEKLQDIFSADPERVELLMPIFEKESDVSFRTDIAILIVLVTDYKPAMKWLIENENWTLIDFKDCRERFKNNQK